MSGGPQLIERHDGIQTPPAQRVVQLPESGVLPALSEKKKPRPEDKASSAPVIAPVPANYISDRCFLFPYADNGNGGERLISSPPTSALPDDKTEPDSNPQAKPEEEPDSSRQVEPDGQQDDGIQFGQHEVTVAAGETPSNDFPPDITTPEGLADALAVFFQEQISYHYEKGRAYIRLPGSTEFTEVKPAKGTEELYKYCVENELPLVATGMEGTAVNCETVAEKLRPSVERLMETSPEYRGANLGYMRYQRDDHESPIPVICPDLEGRAIGEVIADAPSDHVDLALELPGRTGNNGSGPDKRYIIYTPFYDGTSQKLSVKLAQVDGQTALTWDQVKAHYKRKNDGEGSVEFVDNVDRLKQSSGPEATAGD